MDDDEKRLEEILEAAEIEDAWFGFLAKDFQENQSAEWSEVISDLQFWFELGFDPDNGEDAEIREEAREEFRNILADFDIDLYEYDWDDWREWYDAVAG